MNADAAKKQATYADILALPAHVVGEIVAGRLHTQPRPLMGHGTSGSNLHGELYGPFHRGRGGPGGWIFVVEPELHFGRDIVVPDVAGWRSDRVDFKPADPWTSTPPDWVCEILSPSTERFDKGEKRAVYGRAGVGFLWLLDPRARILEAFANANGQWLLAGTASGSGDVALPPFEVASFPLPVLFPLDPPSDEPAA
jgi:Uma2 family endonuclease